MKTGNQNSRAGTIALGVIRNLLSDLTTMVRSSQELHASLCKYNIVRECERDYNYIASRVRKEGLSFLTIALPRLGKWYDEILSGKTGECPEGFKPFETTIRGSERFTCPVFCRMLAFVIFDTAAPFHDRAKVIRLYRSLFYLLYKLESEPTALQRCEAVESWTRNERELLIFEYPWFYDSDAVAAREILAQLCGPADEIFDIRRFSCQHGPGAVAGGEVGDEKWLNANIIPSLHSVYPQYDLYFGHRSSGRISPAMAEEIIEFRKKSKVIKPVSRLVMVPKDSRGPRLICCEPKELMFVQQGASKILMKEFFKRSSGRINFWDRTVNANLALSSSATGEFATVDLKDASDRVSKSLIKLLFPSDWIKYLMALRSSSTELPDGVVYDDTEKYAPMGSALCFPIESACFWSLAVYAGIVSGMSSHDALVDTYVYGDDIIVRSQVVPFLMELFTKFALIVNKEKTYTSGPFRESCGTDAWNGEVVTPFRIKKDIFQRSLSGELATAVCKYSSNCFALDYRETGKYLHQVVSRQYAGIPVSCRELACLHVVDPTKPFIPENLGVRYGWDRSHAALWIMGWCLTTPKKTTILSGLSRLLKNHYGDWREHDPSQVVVPRSTKIRKRRTLVGVGA